jgi:hypothetical protein
MNLYESLNIKWMARRKRDAALMAQHRSEFRKFHWMRHYRDENKPNEPALAGCVSAMSGILPINVVRDRIRRNLKAIR